MDSENLANIIGKFNTLFSDTLRNACDSSKVVGLLFSGGLDSSILASMLAKIHSGTLRLFVAGTELAKDIKVAHAVSEVINLPLIIREFSSDDVKEALPEILSIIEVVDVLQVSLAIPLYLAVKCAQQFDVAVLFSGQGADELFGGYARHERQFIQSGEEAVIVEMQRDLRKLQEKTHPCQQAVVNHFGIEFMTPFLNESLIQFAFNLPMKLKLASSSNGVIRKYFLRLVAQDLGLPPEVVNAPKRAMQYGSGTHRILKNLSREYWSSHLSTLTLREAQSTAKIRQFLNRVKNQGSVS
ncbi:MAG: asparagine synthase C-terminal domain-containing protein [Candidatus Hodarchaeota archaeon]